LISYQKKSKNCFW